MELKKKRPGLFNTSHGVGGLEHFMATERPVRVWYNSDESGGSRSRTSRDRNIHWKRQ